jgi:hypothetical protein
MKLKQCYYARKSKRPLYFFQSIHVLLVCLQYGFFSNAETENEFLFENLKLGCTSEKEINAVQIGRSVYRFKCKNGIPTGEIERGDSNWEFKPSVFGGGYALNLSPSKSGKPICLSDGKTEIKTRYGKLSGTCSKKKLDGKFTYEEPASIYEGQLSNGKLTGRLIQKLGKETNYDATYQNGILEGTELMGNKKSIYFEKEFHEGIVKSEKSISRPEPILFKDGMLEKENPTPTMKNDFPEAVFLSPIKNLHIPCPNLADSEPFILQFVPRVFSLGLTGYVCSGDKPEGRVKLFSPRGDLVVDATFKNGKLDGSIALYRDGKLFLKGLFTEHLPNGTFQLFDGGLLTAERSFVLGKANPETKVYLIERFSSENILNYGFPRFSVEELYEHCSSHPSDCFLYAKELGRRGFKEVGKKLAKMGCEKKDSLSCLLHAEFSYDSKEVDEAFRAIALYATTPSPADQPLNKDLLLKYPNFGAKNFEEVQKGGCDPATGIPCITSKLDPYVDELKEYDKKILNFKNKKKPSSKIDHDFRTELSAKNYQPWKCKIGMHVQFPLTRCSRVDIDRDNTDNSTAWLNYVSKCYSVGSDFEGRSLTFRIAGTSEQFKSMPSLFPKSLSKSYWKKGTVLSCDERNAESVPLVLLD